MSGETPLYSALTKRAASGTLRMHMPGHKGKGLIGFAEASSIDFTELEGTGNLYEGTPPISSAEELAARAAGVAECYFLTGGATQGIMAALSLTCTPGDTILLDRNSHRSIYNAMALLDLRPVYILPELIEGWNLSAPVSPSSVEAGLKAHPEIKTVCITSPTYYGVLSDIEALANAAESYGARLVVDEAHGAHLPYLNGYKSAAASGAALAVTSAHKTLPALGSAAMLYSGGGFDPRDIRCATAMFGTSSPSYVIMASIDAARAALEGRNDYQKTAQLTAELRGRCNRMGMLRALENSAPVDPCRLTLRTLPMAGYDADLYLQREKGVICELSDREHIVFILTAADKEPELFRLWQALEALEVHMAIERVTGEGADSPAVMLTEPPKTVLTPREAAFARHEYIPLERALGRISAGSIAPYPPGIPIVAAGEEITEKHLAYLKNIRYNTLEETSVLK